MVQTFHRIIIKKCHTGEKHNAVCRFLAKEFGISTERADFILRHPPAVLGDLNNIENVDFAKHFLLQHQVECDVKKVIKDKKLPFAINPRQLKWISKEFSKTLRACVETALFYVMIEPSDDSYFLKSLLGKQEEIEDAFRYSDSVFVIDDNTFLLLGFASDREGSDVVFDKIVYCIENYIHRDAIVNIGLSVIPEDGKSFYDLITVAKKNLITFKKDIVGVQKKSETIQPNEIIPKSNVSLSDLQIFSLCFNKARGKFYNELTDLPPDVLWGALSKISVSDQKKFFLKLPHDSPLTSYLAEKIKNQSDEVDVKAARKTVRKVISKMQLVENLKERQENQKKVITFMNQVDTIFTMPSIALQVYHVASDPESDLDDVVKNILLDPSLSIKILKIVNSPFYGLSEKIASIKDAVVMLGMDEVVNMAFGLSLSKSFLDSELKGLMNPEDLWRHSMETAIIARHLSEGLSQFKKMGVFTAGLLHDLGKVYLIENFGDIYTKVLERAEEHSIFISAVEQEIIGIDHGNIGRRIGENWNLPDSLVQAVAFHHQPSAAISYSAFAGLIGFADYLAHMINIRQTENSTDSAIYLKTKQLFKVDHMIIMKKLFTNFNGNFIERTLEESMGILEENHHILNIT
ncbi:putative signal transduction protein (HD domain protein) [Desulfamplus magnetovallimortis]|uniref:Putative signal transduction protein (HD domain protein) n=1 Tax=Desulfamplus magnetovallimortis TaxID=1246637 RepID=A0A1W1HH32_9BACT|nr:HDOD domain-containing protein [Desulfamplus magnetovallimortis]SLM31784.1 putative signal transduction protein (HD domain protein) [Desulfamplus magnetovallimortis]